MKVKFDYYEVADSDFTAVDINFSGRTFANYDIEDYPDNEDEDRLWGNQTEEFDFPLTPEQFVASLPSTYTERT